MRLDAKHMAVITDIFRAIAENGCDTVHALIACEDALVGLQLAMQFGLTPQEVLDRHCEVVENLREPDRVVQ